MSSKTIVAASKVDDALRKVSSCAEMLLVGVKQKDFTAEVPTAVLDQLRSALRDLKEADANFLSTLSFKSKG